MSSIIKIAGKYLDQPMLVSKFYKSVPAVLVGGAAAVTAVDIYKAPDDQKKKTLVRNLCVMAGTVASALLGTRGLKPIKFNGKEIFKGFEGLSEYEQPHSLKAKQTKLVDTFIKNNKVSSETKSILEKAKTKVLSLKEVGDLHKDLETTENGKEFLTDLIPDPEMESSKEVLGEIGRLSLIGLVPVAGGIAGGIAGDKLTDKDWKQKIPNKIKEGAYQYLANIFLCNVGAGAALAITEKLKVKSKPIKAASMLAGIAITGVIGGSAIANVISQKIIDPLLGTKHAKQEKETLYSERKPEALDIGLHIDDVATVAVMSGLSWIEPALPILYSVSGYRAGIGYRNGKEIKKEQA